MSKDPKTDEEIAKHCRVCNDKTKRREWSPPNSKDTLYFWDCPQKHGYFWKTKGTHYDPTWKLRK